MAKNQAEQDSTSSLESNNQGFDDDEPQPQLNEEEPQLKYEQLAGDVASVVAKDEISCLRLSDKILAVGTIKGKVHLLDYSGNQVGQSSQGLMFVLGFFKHGHVAPTNG